MTKKSIRFLAMLIVGVALACSWAQTCYALKVSDENIQINLHPTWTGDSSLHFLPNMDVHVLVTDPTGKKMGPDPVPGVGYDEFPASYGQTSNDNNFFSIEVMFNLTEGTYIFEVWSDNLTGFLMDAYVSRRASTSMSLSIAGVLDNGLKSKFEFTYTSDPSKPAGMITRMADPASLKQDIQVSRKLQMIDNDGIMKSLMAKADAIDAAIARGNKTAAKNQIEAFLSEVAAQKGKHLTDEAARMLTEDAEYLIKTLK